MEAVRVNKTNRQLENVYMDATKRTTRNAAKTKSPIAILDGQTRQRRWRIVKHFLKLKNILSKYLACVCSVMSDSLQHHGL